MKKMLKRLLVLVVAATILVMPASTALAESNLVLEDRTADYVSYAFQPDPYFLSAGQEKLLINDYEADDLFHVDPYTNISFFVYLNYYSTYRIRVVNITTNELVYNKQFSGYGCGFTVLNQTNYGSKYRVIINADTDVYITRYGASTSD
jgi:hypothetical protein